MGVKKFYYDFSVLSRENATSFYLLGCYFADGYIRAKGQRGSLFSITSADEDWILLIRDLLRSTHRRTKTKNGCYILKINDSENVSWFVNWGCVPNKSRIVELPAIPELYFRDFVRGLFDGDGCVTQCFYQKKKGDKVYYYRSLTSYICSGSQSLILSLKDKLDALGIVGCFAKIPHPPKEDVYRLSFGSGTARKFLSWLYYDDQLPSMPRKANLASKAFAYYEQNGNRATKEDYETQTKKT